MTYTPTVNPTTEEPTGHASLSDGTTTLNIVFYNPNKKTTWFNKKTGKEETIVGDIDELAIKRYPIIESALKTYEGDLTYDSENPPYFLSAQDDWSGGRGQEDFERDKTRFFDSYNIDTLNGEDGIILGGLATNSTGHYVYPPVSSLPGNITWRGLYGTRKYLSRQFTTGAGQPTYYTISSIQLYIRKVGSPTTTLHVVVWANGGGPPDTSSNLVHYYLSYGYVTNAISIFYDFNNGITSSAECTPATVYHIGIFSSSDDTEANHWEIGCDASGSNYRSATGEAGSWTSETGYAPYYVVGREEGSNRKQCHLFLYKDALYMATQPDDGTAGRLYINGYRGACASNSANLSYLMTQSTPPWGADEINNKVAIITGGPGAQSHQNWRMVLDSTTTANVAARVHIPYVEMSSINMAWDIAHTTATDFVIRGCNTWTEITSTGLTKPVTSVEVINEVVYMAQGNDAPVIRFFAVNNAGAWTNYFSSGGAYADFLKATHDPISGNILWMGRVGRTTQYTSELIKAIAPLRYSSTEKLSGTVLDDCQDTWAEDSIANTVQSFANNEVVSDISAVFTTGNFAEEAITSTDVRPFNLVCFKITSSVDLAAGVVQFMMDNTAKCASPTIAVDLPAMRAGVWYDMALAIDPLSCTDTEVAAIISIGFRITADQDKAITFRLSGPVRACTDLAPIQLRGRLNGLQPFGSPELPYVLQEDEIGYVENNLYTPLEIPGFKALSSPDNGRAHEDYDGYLAFSFHKGVMLYYGTTQKYLGPDVDAGMPSDRKGTAVDFVSWGDRLYVAYDGGYSNYSSVLCYHSNGWHEVYRSPTTGKRIRNIFIESIPGRETQKLWISMGADLISVPIARNPFEVVKSSAEFDMRFASEGTLETSFMYTGRRELQKFFNTLKVWVENVSAGNYYVEADYKLDGDSTWTAVSGDFDTVPVEEILLSSATPPTSKGKRIRVRLHLVTNDNTKTPRVKVIALEMVAFSKVKYGYAFYYCPADGQNNLDLKDVPDTTFANTNAIFTKIDSWASNATPLTLNCIFAPYNGKTVIINPMQTAPMSLDLGQLAGDGREVHIGYISCIEA
ncbi:MAG: hypothetical protein WC455_20270 [Dehalococcoidia bacterium]|jgi:hypothetical protein